jgi:hypothetical protein
MQERYGWGTGEKRELAGRLVAPSASPVKVGTLSLRAAWLLEVLPGVVSEESNDA